MTKRGIRAEKESKWMCVYATYACVMNEGEAENDGKGKDTTLKGYSYKQNIF